MSAADITDSPISEVLDVRGLIVLVADRRYVLRFDSPSAATAAAASVAIGTPVKQALAALDGGVLFGVVRCAG